MPGALKKPGRKLDRLTRRAEYLAAGKGLRFHAKLLSLQGARRDPADAQGSDDAGMPRFGLTVSRKVGNSVERNRVKRRLREALKVVAGQPEGSPGQSRFDYVIVARRDILSTDFQSLVEAITQAIGGLHKPRRQGAPRAAASSPAFPPPAKTH